MMKKIKCPHCKCIRKSSDFIADGRQYKSCSYCRKWGRTQDAKRKEKQKITNANKKKNQPEYSLFKSAQSRAKHKSIVFDITETDIKILIDKTSKCILLNMEFKQEAGPLKDNSMTLDKIDPAKGYTKDNIQLISNKANKVKSDIDISMFEKIVDGFRKFVVIEHDIDDETRKIIVLDRRREIKNRQITNKDRIIHLECALYQAAKSRAQSKNMPINIDTDYIKSIWPLDNKCPILDIKFEFGKNHVMSDYSATMDRIDNSKGYICGNVRIISARANIVKNDCTLEELELILANWKNLR